MVFSSLEFLFFFFPLVFGVYICIKPGLANIWLLMASLAFYYVGDRQHMYLLICIIAVAYLSGILIQKFRSKQGKRFFCCGSIVVMTGIIAYFKYWDFLIKNVNEFFGRNVEVEGIILPIGISFFIFQAISYVIDVYRGEKALKNPVDMGLYISFFPQLIAGPIVRFHDISEYMDKKYREINIANIENGIWRFCIGLSKKVLLANNLGGLADLVFGGGYSPMFCFIYLAWCRSLYITDLL